MSIPDQYDDILIQNKQIILNGIIGAATPSEVESSVFFARYIRNIGINPTNYWIFLRILETNNKYIVDSLVGNNDPRLLFTILKPNRAIIKRAFQLLTVWHPGQIYYKVLLAILGIIESCYHNANDGYEIYDLDISELNNIGKFLDPEMDQDDLINATILDILDWISSLGRYDGDLRKINVAKQSHGIRMAYFDNTKKLTDIISKVLLVRIEREKSEVKPSPEFLAFMEKLSHTSI
jgi:hypothetical protein